MSLRKDYSLSKDFDFSNSEEVSKIYENYQAEAIPGHYFKNLLHFFIKLYKGICGEGEDIDRVYSALDVYSSVNVTDSDYSFADEAEKLKNLHVVANQYLKMLDLTNRQLDSSIDGWLGKINSTTLTPEQRAQDLKFVTQSAFILNRRNFVYETDRYTFALINGLLKLEDDSDDFAENGDISFDEMDLPLFAHIPVVEDISEESLAENKMMQILFNIVEQDSYVPMNMIRARGDGNAIVRLWKKENGEDTPYFYTVSISEIYLAKVGYAGENAMWPGLIEAALMLMECPDADAPYAILGPELKDYDLEYLLGPNIPPIYETNQNHNDMIHAYIKCYFDAYSSFLGTNSLVIKDSFAYSKLMFALWEVIYALTCCFDRTFDVNNSAIVYLETSIAEYKQFVRENPAEDPMAKKRIAICGTIEELIKIGGQDSEYRKTPRLYFEKMLAAKIAKVLLESMKEEVTPQALEKKAEAVLNDEIFQKQAAKINVHTMKTASDKFAATVLAKMERR